MDPDAVAFVDVDLVRGRAGRRGLRVESSSSFPTVAGVEASALPSARDLDSARALPGVAPPVAAAFFLAAFLAAFSFFFFSFFSFRDRRLSLPSSKPFFIFWMVAFLPSAASSSPFPSGSTPAASVSVFLLLRRSSFISIRGSLNGSVRFGLVWCVVWDARGRTTTQSIVVAKPRKLRATKRYRIAHQIARTARTVRGAGMASDATGCTRELMPCPTVWDTVVSYCSKFTRCRNCLSWFGLVVTKVGLQDPMFRRHLR